MLREIAAGQRKVSTLTQPPQGPGPQQGNWGAQPPNYGPPPGNYPQQPPRKKRRWPWIVLGVVVLVVIIGIANGGKSSNAPTVAQTTAGGTATATATATASAPASAAPSTTSAAASAAPSTTNAAAPLSVGSAGQFTSGGASGSVTLNSTKRISASESGFGGPPKNGSYLVVDVTIKIDSGNGKSNPLYV